MILIFKMISSTSFCEMGSSLNGMERVVVVARLV